MLKTLLGTGIVLTLGSGAVAYDYTRLAGGQGQPVLSLSEYAGGLQGRVVNLMEREPGPRVAKLPQVSRRMATASTGFDTRSSAEQIDDFVKGSPQVQAIVARQRAQAKESWWARIRQKVTGDSDTARSDRLAGIRDRNYPTRKEGLAPEDLANMSAAEIVANQAAIREGLSVTAQNRMQDAIAASAGAGLD